MAPPIYFFPGLPERELSGPRMNPAILKRYGLADTLGDLGPIREAVGVWPLPGVGPSGGGGMLATAFIDGNPPARMAYLKDQQTWVKVQNDPELWIGLDNEQPPGPDDLVRSTTISGHPVKLKGNEYQIPIIRSPISGTGLPEDMLYDPDGKFVVALQPRWQQLWDETGDVWDMLYSDDHPYSMDFSKILDLSLKFIGVNYRYGRFEQAAMRLIDTNKNTWLQIFNAALDVPTLNEVAAAQKKSDDQSGADILSTELGKKEDDPNTDQAAATSQGSTAC